MAYFIVRSETDIREQINTLKKRVFEIKTTRRAEIQEMVIGVKWLEWVIDEDKEYIRQRLEKLNGR